MILRKLTPSEVQFTTDTEPEDSRIESYPFDKDTIDWIYTELKCGNEYAWCCVCVTAKWSDFVGKSYLGACSYSSKEELENDCNEQMRADALDDLNSSIQRIADPLGSLVDYEASLVKAVMVS